MHFKPSALSRVTSSNLPPPSIGRVRSQSAPSILAATMLLGQRFGNAFGDRERRGAIVILARGAIGKCEIEMLIGCSLDFDSSGVVRSVQASNRRSAKAATRSSFSPPQAPGHSLTSPGLAAAEPRARSSSFPPKRHARERTQQRRSNRSAHSGSSARSKARASTYKAGLGPEGRMRECSAWPPKAWIEVGFNRANAAATARPNSRRRL